MDAYNKEHNRTKSLLEIHKESKKHQIGGERRGFDRTKDLRIVDANDKAGYGGGLESRFGKSGKFI